MELTSQELEAYYSLIENKSDKEIQKYINIEMFRSETFGDSKLAKCIPRLTFGKAIPDHHQSLPSRKLFEICKKYAAKNSTKIKTILQENRQKTNYALNIIQLLAPAIAQQYSGIPAMAIVGSITLLCRQGIDNFIK